MKNVSGIISKLLLIFVSIFILAPSVFSANYTTYQAKIIKPDGYPLESNNVNFKFTILEPAGNCILYSETYSSVNMANTGGLISFSLGSGVKTYPVSSPTFFDIFNNAIANHSCDAGGPVSYSPNSDDTRKIVMQFHDGNGWQTLPAMTINAVPYAMYANDSQKLGGVSATSYVRYSTIPTCTASQALQYTGASFNCVALPSAGAFSAADVATALSYTPADAVSVTSLNSEIGNVSSTVYAVSSTVNSLSSNFSSLQNSVAVSLAAITSSQWISSGTTLFYNSGNVVVSGGLRISMDVTACSISLAGALRYNSGAVEYCNGTTWAAFGVSGAGLQGLNGSTSGTQTFAIGTTGAAPAFITNNGVHTLNIPLASVGSVTGGLLSNADYSTFMNKITSSTASIAQVLGYTPANSATVSLINNSATASFTSIANDLTSVSNTLAAKVSSQWTSAASNIYYNSGLVGIGTSSPTGQLEIVSNISNQLLYQLNTSLNQSTTTSGAFSVVGVHTWVRPMVSGGVTNSSTTYGGATRIIRNVYAGVDDGGVLSSIYGSHIAVGHSNVGPSLPHTSNVTGLQIDPQFGAGLIDSYYGLRLGTGTTGASVTARYGLAQDDPLAKNYFTGAVGIGVTSATAALQLKAGTANWASLKLTSGTLLTSPQSGTVEYDGANYYVTDGSNVRRTIATGSASGTLDSALINNASGNIVMTPNGSVIVSATTASTNSQTGALVVNGGLGVGGNIFSSGTIITSSNIQGASITATNGMIAPYIAGSIVSGGTLTLDSTTHGTKGKIILSPNGGSVGIGTTNPDSALTVATGAAPETTVIPQSADNVTLFGDGNAYFQGRDVTNDIEFIMGTSTASEVFSGSMSDHDYALRTGNANRMYLKHSNGFVGVNTQNPIARLHVNASSGVSESVAIAFYPTVNAVSLPAYGIGMGPTSSEGYLAYRSGTGNSNLHGHKFFVNDTERMRINGLGYVGIGTVNPTYVFDLLKSSGGNLAHFTASGDDHGAYIFGNTAGGYFSGNTSFDGTNWIAKSATPSVIKMDPGGTEFFTNAGVTIGAAYTPASRMKISASGMVGIGTSAPSTNLDISGADQSVAIRVTNLSSISDRYPGFSAVNYSGNVGGFPAINVTNHRGSSGSLALLQAGDNIGVFNGQAAINISGTLVNTAQIAFRAQANHSLTSTPSNIHFFTTPQSSTVMSDRMVITEAGNVGVGVSAPVEKLEVAGNLKVTGDIITSVDSGWALGGAPTLKLTGRSGASLTNATTMYRTATPLALHRDFRASFSYRTSNSTHFGLTFHSQLTDPHDNNYAVIMRSTNVVRVQKRAAAVQTVPIGEIATGLSLSDGNWHTVDVEVVGQNIVVDIDGTNFVNSSLADGTFTNGRVGFINYDGTVEFNNLVVQEISDKTLAKGLIVPEGNVGIGTTTPDTRVRVIGKIKVGTETDNTSANLLPQFNDVFELVSQNTTSAPAMAFHHRGLHTLQLGSWGSSVTEQGLLLKSGGGEAAAQLHVQSHITSKGGNLHTYRGRLAFSNTPTDSNHTIYNNLSNLDGEGSWDGMKMNVFDGLSVRVGQSASAVPATALHINVSGTVGVGTTAPAAGYRMDVNGDLIIGNGGTAQKLQFRTASTDSGFIRFNATSDAANGSSLEIGTTDNNDEPIIFTQSGNERMRIHTNAYVGIGTSTPTTHLAVNSNTATGYTIISNKNSAAGGLEWRWYSSSTGAPLGANSMCIGLGACILSIYSTGDATLAGTLTQSSDVRLKRDISSIPNALDAVTKLEGVTYFWKDSAKDATKQIGLIAQDVEKVFPEAVKTNAQGFKSVAYQNLIAPLINALREVREWMFATDERVSALEKDNAKIKAENQMLKEYLCEKDPSAKICF